MKSTTDKGIELENHVAQSLRESGLDPKARRDDGSGRGTKEKGDIVTSAMVFGQNLGIECKNAAAFCVGDWWKQTKKLESLGREPILVFKHILEPNEEAKVVIYLDTLIELLRHAGTGSKLAHNTKRVQDDREVVYSSKRAIEAIRALHRAIEKFNEQEG